MRLSRLLDPRLLVMAALAVGLSACATRPPANEPEAVAEFQAANDPLEPLNRTMYQVNEGLDTLVLRPAAEIYRFFLPYEVRLGVRNVLTNLRAPTVLANDLLQGQTQRAGRTASRFVINSTLGLGGIIDVADRGFGIRGHNEDFGQTLAAWGVQGGPYLFVPGLGPSNPRDLFGFGVDAVASPWFWVGQGAAVEALRYSRTGATIVDTREGVIDTLDDINRTSLDPYTTIRSGYRQRREAEIRNELVPAGRRTGLTP
ncbi:MlaA family lipoprotein [Roseococcus suduntuyensis]|uniref:Phospholipid-binding lipoprotein MlaA n=1 Tax=Roseococcus suduntuyensis TaxID=455361 RepID=A0A840AB78_9PROT|nr:VacJ family lipoprotein [Roseococcus suduntuyensis]MBB3898337.1 phospholipid-binding lipoprotein MlaA [Roseococcus suduntuyensis]